jgi:hypothetical protein
VLRSRSEVVSVSRARNLSSAGFVLLNPDGPSCVLHLRDRRDDHKGAAHSDGLVSLTDAAMVPERCTSSGRCDLSAGNEVACLSSAQYLVTVGSASKMRKLVASSAEWQVYGGSSLPISENAASRQLGQ